MDLFRYLYIRTGRKIDLGGKINLKTTGYGYQLSGVLKILYFLDIQYNYSRWEDDPEHPLSYTYFESWTVTFSNLDQVLLKIFD